MNHLEGSFTGVGGLRIFHQSWRPAEPRASVVITHGLGEHGGRYGHVAAALVDIGCAVHAIDHRGHGKSEGPRPLIDRFDHAVADIDQLVDLAAGQLPGRPLFLLGHSMGGALALDYALEHAGKLSGLMVSAPAISLDAAPPMKWLAKLLSVIAPRLGVHRIDPSWVSRDPATVADYIADPLNAHGPIPARTLGEMIAFADHVPSALQSITLPLLALHGSADRLARVAGSRMIAERAGSTDMTLKIYDGLEHEIFNELPEDRAIVLKDMTGWISTRIEDRG